MSIGGRTDFEKAEIGHPNRLQMANITRRGSFTVRKVVLLYRKEAQAVCWVVRRGVGCWTVMKHSVTGEIAGFKASRRGWTSSLKCQESISGGTRIASWKILRKLRLRAQKKSSVRLEKNEKVSYTSHFRLIGRNKPVLAGARRGPVLRGGIYTSRDQIAIPSITLGTWEKKLRTQASIRACEGGITKSRFNKDLAGGGGIVRILLERQWRGPRFCWM